MTVSVGVAAVVVTATVVPARVSEVSPAVKLSADSTALLLCGGGCPTFRDADLQVIMNQFITPTHPGQSITPVAVTTPNEDWPITGILRLIGSAVGDPRLFGPGGGGWPDEPWWKLSGFFDLTRDQSNLVGVANLEQAMAAYGNDHLVIYGYSQGAMTANLEKRRLAEQYPAGTAAPAIDFVLGGDVNLPNGGLHARFPGLYIPVLDWAFNGPAPTDTQFDTVEINQQYDGAADFPLYPLNVVADLNAVMGFLYLHTYPFDVSLPADPTTSPAYQGTHGDTSYYFFETQDLPLFAPLRMLGVPESLIDVVEPFFRVLVELGYDRSIPPWEPTPARLIPTLNPVTVTADLVNAIGEGINNATARVGSPPLSVSAPVTLAAPADESAKADLSPQMTSKEMPTRTEQEMSTGAAIDTRQVSTDTAPLTAVTETANADVSPQDAPSEPVTETDQPTSTQTSSDTAQPTSPNAARASTLKPENHRPLVRDSLRVGQQPSERSERGEGDQPTTRTFAAGAEASTGQPSSTGSSSAGSSSAGSSSDSGSSGGDGDGS
ncbi:PE-PPE domain-containing protein [Mycolicibacterium sp. P9-64]|nr:PE-PPE domain-containing protein [Mycolicibacterium sp. P9-64]